jgi:hypothetical protein
MISQSPYILTVNERFDQKTLKKNTWLVILHASRIPPHIGVLIDGNYNSLTIKGHELNVNINALLKTIQQKKIEVLFVQLKYHPVFSTDYQKEICQHYIQQFTQVKPDEASCLSPVKLFLQEFYVLPLITEELLFELMDRLNQNNYIVDIFGLNLNTTNLNEFSLPIYSNKELQAVIKSERAVFYKD